MIDTGGQQEWSLCTTTDPCMHSSIPSPVWIFDSNPYQLHEVHHLNSIWPPPSTEHGTKEVLLCTAKNLHQTWPHSSQPSLEIEDNGTLRSEVEKESDLSLDWVYRTTTKVPVDCTIRDQIFEWATYQKHRTKSMLLLDLASMTSNA